MKLFRTLEEKYGVDEPDYEPTADVPEPIEELKERYTVSYAGAGIAVVGGVLLAVSVFLPLDEHPAGLIGALGGIQRNTLVQHGEWWLILLGVVAIAAAVTARKGTWMVWATGLLAASAVGYLATDKSLRTLYTLAESGTAEGTGRLVSFGPAIYVAGIGAALVIIGGVVMSATTTRIAGETTKPCPECAETIQRAAHLCRHCGTRLDATS